MFTISTIQTAFFTTTWLVGFKQDLASEHQVLEEECKTSASGLYVNDFHSLITTGNIRAVATEGMSNSELTTWLKNLCNGSTAKVLREIYEGERSLHEVLRLYDYTNVYDNTITLTGNGFVGYEIDPAYLQGMRVKIDNVGTWFDGAETATIYLFHSSQQAALQSQAISTTANAETWQALSWDLDYISSSYSGGKFYIGYRKQDTTYNPINRNWNLANVQNCAKYFGITPISVPDYTGTTLFDIDTIQYESDTYGLNFEFTVKTDLTRHIIQQKLTYAYVIAMQIARDVLERIANSTRTNEIKKETRDMAWLELKGTEGFYQSGLEYKLRQTIKDARLQLSKNVIPDRQRITTYTAR